MRGLNGVATATDRAQATERTGMGVQSNFVVGGRDLSGPEPSCLLGALHGDAR